MFLQRLEEREKSFLVAVRQCSEGIRRRLGLATMARDGLGHCLRREVVEEGSAIAQSPQRSGPDHIEGRLPTVLDNRIMGSDVV